MASRKHRAGSTTRVHRVKPVNEEAAEELELFAENTGELYPMKKKILAQLAQKRAKGKYDPSLAPMAWAYYVDAAAKRYQREIGPLAFDKPTRTAVAIHLAKRFENGER